MIKLNIRKRIGITVMGARCEFTADFERLYTYDTYGEDDLGANWTAEKTIFRVWAPTAVRLRLNLYRSGNADRDDLIETIEMLPDKNGTWKAEKTGNLNGIYYTYTALVGGRENESADPYARAAGVNGQRSGVIDLDATNPIGWENDKNPNLNMRLSDIVIYELHVRDFSFHESSEIKHKGKYLAFTERGTKNSIGMATGVDYLADLGITHLHLLPVFDFGSVDETATNTDQYNWGYDPLNYNVPEGSYSTDPYNGEVRIREFKEMVQSLHQCGISVIMDVVYNHTYNTDFCFNKLVPEYFYRADEVGNLSNGSGCGNDVATERIMVRKYITDSVLYWAKEYHIDGFRFDLAGLIDVDTINEIDRRLKEQGLSALLYGEGWSMNTKPVKENIVFATQNNSSKTKAFAYFNDGIRDAIKGSVFSATDRGYVNGASGKTEEIKKAVQGLPSWTDNPCQVINYSSCHDNLTLWDKIASSNGTDTVEERVLQNKLAAAIVFTSQGIPFIHAGEELLRTKRNDDGSFNHNSYASGSLLNSIKWDEAREVYNYYKGLITFRKNRAAFNLTTADMVKNNITFLPDTDENVVAFIILNHTLIIYNPNRTDTEINLPSGEWGIYVNEVTAGNVELDTAIGRVSVKPISCMVLIKHKGRTNVFKLII